MTPSASLLQAISGLTAPKAAVPSAMAAGKPALFASRVETFAPRDGRHLPEAPDPAAPRGRYLDIVA